MSKTVAAVWNIFLVDNWGLVKKAKLYLKAVSIFPVAYYTNHYIVISNWKAISFDSCNCSEALSTCQQQLSFYNECCMLKASPNYEKIVGE